MQRIQTHQNEIFERRLSTTKGTDYDDNGKEVTAKKWSITVVSEENASVGVLYQHPVSLSYLRLLCHSSQTLVML